MTSILKVSEIQDPTNSNTALTIDAAGQLFLDGTQAVVKRLGGSSFTTGAVWVNLGSISIPQAGIWLIRADLRMRGSGSGFVKARLGTSSSGGEIGKNGGGGANTAISMIMEQISSTGSFFNINISPCWTLDMPTGLTYPYDIYLHIQASTSDAWNALVDDVNGQPALTAIRANSTSTTGTTIETIGDA